VAILFSVLCRSPFAALNLNPSLELENLDYKYKRFKSDVKKLILPLIKTAEMKETIHKWLDANTNYASGENRVTASSREVGLAVGLSAEAAYMILLALASEGNAINHDTASADKVLSEWSTVQIIAP
jgi:hypothetical protein